MQEAELKRVLLVRAFEEVEEGAFLPESIAAANEAAGERDELAPWLLRRADVLLERMPAGLAELANGALPPRWLLGAVPAGAALLGVAGASLGPGGKIHLFVNPMMALVLWSVGAYLAFLATGGWKPRGADAGANESLRAPTSVIAGNFGWLGRGLLAGFRWLVRLWGRGAASTAEGLGPVATRFRALHAAHAAAPATDRVRGILNLSAVGFALGTLAGMYLRGVGFGYRAFWESTLVGTEAARESLVHGVFLPGALALGGAFPDAEAVRALADPAGAEAAIWLHVWAITGVAYVLLPRLGLALFHFRRAARAARALEIDEDDPHWRRILDASRLGGVGRVEQGVLREFALDATATTVLASLQASLVEADIKATAPTRGSNDGLQRKKDWYAEWQDLWRRRFEEFSGADVPQILGVETPEFAAACEALEGSQNRHAQDLILLELVGFEPYWPSDGKRRRMRPFGGSSLDKEVRRAGLRSAAKRLGRSEAWPVTLERASSSALKDLSRFWARVGTVALGGLALGALTAGLAAPIIGSAFGGLLGLASAIAANTGLAALGFGAILHLGSAAVAHGTVILVGGGALLGLAGGGGVAAMNAGLNARTVLVLAVKIDVFLREVVVGRQGAWDEFERIVGGLRSVADTLRDEVPDLRLAPDVTSNEVRERERVVAVLDDLITRCDRWQAANRPGAPAQP